MRIVVKVGTSTLTHSSGRINLRRIEKLCRVISDLKNENHEMILVSSGAIGMGAGKLSLPERPEDIPTKQACAAIGQCELMYVYDKEFSQYHYTVAQILITATDIDNETRHMNFKNTIACLLRVGAIPIINENDTVSTEEIVIGDNDTLGAIVAASVEADMLILLSDIEGLYTDDPRKNPEARLIARVDEITDDILCLGGGKGSALGTGGMKTKLHAADIATKAGIDMVIASGKDPDILYDIAAGKPVGTLFKAKRNCLE